MGALVAAGLLLAIGGGIARGQAGGDAEKEIDLERTVTIEARLLGVEKVPVRGSIAVARFRFEGGAYRGSTLGLAYDYSRPVRLRSWDIHDASGYRRIGGAEVRESAVGRWDALLRPGSHEPVNAIVLMLTQHDLNEDEERRRWHFKAIESIEPLSPGAALDTAAGSDPSQTGSRSDR